MSEDKVKLIDFWAEWCGPCKLMHPIIEELEKEYGDKVTVEKYDVDDAKNQEIVRKYQVMSMPTYFIEKNGKVLQQLVGAQSKSTLTNILDQAIG